MIAIAIGWKLAGISLVVLFVAAVAGLVSYDRSSPRVLRVRRAAAAAAILALLTVVVIVIVGPGSWCGPGDAYKVRGCA